MSPRSCPGAPTARCSGERRDPLHARSALLAHHAPPLPPAPMQLPACDLRGCIVAAMLACSDNDGPAPQVSPDDAWVEGTESEDDVDGHAGGYLAAGRRRRSASKSRKAADPTAAFGSPKRSGLRVKKKYQRGGSGYRPPSGVGN